MTQNISGGRSKINAIIDRISNLHYDVIAIQETWFLPSITDQEIIANIPFNIFRRDRCNFKSGATTGGGVAFFVRDSFTATEVILGSRTNIEMVCIYIEDDKTSFVILNVYVPPPRNSLTCALEIETAIGRIYNQFPTSRIIICGDFNAPGIHWIYDDDEHSYLSHE